MPLLKSKKLLISKTSGKAKRYAINHFCNRGVCLSMTSAARLRRAADKHTPLKGQGGRKTRARRSRPLNRSGELPLFRSLVFFLQAAFCVFHLGYFLCPAWQQLASGSVFCSCHKRVIRTVSCRADLFQEVYVFTAITPPQGAFRGRIVA